MDGAGPIAVVDGRSTFSVVDWAGQRLRGEMMPTVKARNKLCKHIQDNRLYYVDLGELLPTGVTVSSATVASTDTALTIGTPAVLSSDTTVEDEGDPPEDVVIEANTGISVNLSAGTVGQWLVTVVATLSDSSVAAEECDLEIDGESA